MTTVELSEIKEKVREYAERCVRELRSDLRDAADETLVVRLMDLFATHLLSPKAIVSDEELRAVVDVLPPEREFTRDEVVEMLREARSLLRGHFELLSGLHTFHFFRFGDLAAYAERMAKDLIARSRIGDGIDAVLTPTSAGAVLGSEVARQLQSDLLYADVDGQGRPASLRPSSFLLKDRNVLIVNDMITTGRGAECLVEIARAQSWRIEGVAVFAVRGSEPDRIVRRLERTTGLPVWATAQLKLAAFPSDECDLCAKEIPYYRSANLNR